MKKGISPLIASVLLIAFTMSVALVAGPFFSNTLKDVQTGTSDSTNRLSTATSMAIDMNSVRYNRTSGQMQVTVQNTGQRNITNLTVTLLGDTPVQKEYDQTIGVRRIDTINLDVSETVSLEEIRVSVDNYPVQDSSEIRCMPEKGLVGYWSMNNEQTNGGTLEDLSVSENSGTLNGGVTKGVSGVVGEAYSFDGVDDNVQTAWQYSSGPITWSAWINIPSTSTRDIYMSTGPIYAEVESDDQLKLWTKDLNDNGGTVRTSDYVPGQWALATFVFDQNYDLQLYLNNQKKDETTIFNTDLLTGNPLHIGSHSGDNYWSEGRVDEVRIYNRSLSQDEIERLYTIREKDLAVRGCELVK